MTSVSCFTGVGLGIKDLGLRRLAVTLVVCLVVLGGVSALAREKLPRHKSSSHPPSDTVFSSPDAEPDVVPAFVGKGGKPVNLEHPPRLPGFEQLRLLNDLTAEQNKRISQLQSDTNERVRAVQEHMAVVQQKLDVAKAHQSELLIIQGAPLPKAAELKAEIAELRKSIEQKRRDASEELNKILTQAQRDQIDRMRRGQLVEPQALPLPAEVVDDNTSKTRRTIFGAFGRKHSNKLKHQNEQPDDTCD